MSQSSVEDRIRREALKTEGLITTIYLTLYRCRLWNKDWQEKIEKSVHKFPLVHRNNTWSCSRALQVRSQHPTTGTNAKI
jgi:hypothetical protein